ncbi:hypothetical protein [Alkalihalobacillus deserti]|uniref:hypothetical protein n=1 Tax=Alkalihalobacillus deserti TaxID=2879466 RepID=UPI001D1348C0|nr:hypothetical protein [Alkalihalobacillus deserti]
MNETVYITNSEGSLLETEATVGADGQSIEVKASSDYQVNESYYLYISDGIRSESGQVLKENVMMEFMVSH